MQELKRDIHGLIAAKTNIHLGRRNVLPAIRVPGIDSRHGSAVR